MSNTLTIHLERIRSGQQRRYGDSHYDANITLTGPTKYLPGERLILELSKVLVREWSHDARTDKEIPWHATRLVRVTSGLVTHDAEADTYQQVWSVYIMQPYLD